jgi:hypothetical protein
VEEGKADPKPTDPEYDLSVPIKTADGEEHTYSRRRGSKVICRNSNKKYCFFSKREIERLLELLSAYDEPKPEASPAPAKAGKASTESSKTAGTWATLTADIEATMKAAGKNLRKLLGKESLPPWTYGTRLHKTFADLFRAMKLPKGWSAFIEKPLRLFKGVNAKTLGLTVEGFLSGHPEGASLIGLLPETLLKTKIGNLEPDLVLLAPDGSLVVWDLAPSSQEEHLAKTLIYAFVLGESGHLTQIGESYYQWQRHIEVDTFQQSRFTEPELSQQEGARVSLTADQTRSLLRKNAGTGKPLEGKPQPGFSGGAELIPNNKTVVGQYLDPTTGKWTDTNVFSIHYTENGLYLRPEKP